MKDFLLSLRLFIILFIHITLRFFVIFMYFMHKNPRIHIHIHTRTHTLIHIHTLTCTHTYIQTYIYTHTYILTYIHRHAYTYIHTHTHIYIYIYIYIYMYIYVHIHVRGRVVCGYFRFYISLQSSGYFTAGGKHSSRLNHKNQKTACRG